MSSSVILALDSLAAGGEAVGRLAEGLVVFVPGGAPGDRVEVTLTERKKGFARGRLLRVLEPGAGRVEPACPLSSGRCGGCPWMHVGRPVQLVAKEDLIRRALRHSGAEIWPILSPAPPLGFRIRARLVARGGALGFAAARSHDVVDLTACPALVPTLERALVEAAAALRGKLGEEGTLAGVVGAGQVHLSATLGRGGDRAAVQAVLAALVSAGTVAGVMVTGPAGWHRGVTAVDVGGGPGPLWVAADSFAQASAAGHDALLTAVDEALDQPVEQPIGQAFGAGPGGGRIPRLLELYAGAGNLTRRLRLRADSLVAVEADAQAAARLEAGAGAGPGPVTVLRQRAESAVAALQRTGERFTVAVLDPPRAGAAEVMAALPQLGVDRVVYVSCDPMTLGRDLMTLRRLGYVIRSAQPLDLVPHSAHVETVALADRAG